MSKYVLAHTMAHDAKSLEEIRKSTGLSDYSIQKIIAIHDKKRAKRKIILSNFEDHDFDYYFEGEGYEQTKKEMLYARIKYQRQLRTI